MKRIVLAALVALASSHAWAQTFTDETACSEITRAFGPPADTAAVQQFGLAALGMTRVLDDGYIVRGLAPIASFWTEEQRTNVVALAARYCVEEPGWTFGRAVALAYELTRAGNRPGATPQ
jgi:hypothetical protein